MERTFKARPRYGAGNGVWNIGRLQRLAAGPHARQKVGPFIRNGLCAYEDIGGILVCGKVCGARSWLRVASRLRLFPALTLYAAASECRRHLLVDVGLKMQPLPAQEEIRGPHGNQTGGGQENMLGEARSTVRLPVNTNMAYVQDRCFRAE